MSWEPGASRDQAGSVPKDEIEGERTNAWGKPTPETRQTSNPVSAPANSTDRMATRTDREDSPKPTATSELLPRPLVPLAELLMLPFFWLAPLLLVVLGGSMALDIQKTGRRLERYGVEKPFDSRSYLWCVLPFVIGHIGTLFYRFLRVQSLRQTHGFSAAAFSRQADGQNPSSGRLVVGVVGLQLLGLVALFFPVDGLDALYAAGLLVILGGLLVLPVVIWYDLRQVRRLEAVDWGWPRYAHVAFGWIPGVVFVYLACRTQQVKLATLIDCWETDPAAIEPDPNDLTRLERIGNRLEAL